MKMYLNSIFTIAWLTFKEAIRKRFLVGILGISIIFLLLNFFCESATMSSDSKEVDTSNFGVSILFLFICFWNTTIAALLSGAMLSEELEAKTYTMTLSKPISRHAYLLGKFTGILILILMNSLLVPMVYMLFKLSAGARFNYELWYAILSIYPGFILAASFSMLFTLFINRIMGFLITSAIILVSFLVDIAVYESSIYQALDQVKDKRTILEFFYWSLPQFGTVFYESMSHIAKRMAQAHSLGLYSYFHTGAWIIVTWIAIFIIFERRELD
jgi:ABC-type transport system involved in multi-copper enzyme maturation permease subunit